MHLYPPSLFQDTSKKNWLIDEHHHQGWGERQAGKHRKLEIDTTLNSLVSISGLEGVWGGGSRKYM